MSEKGKTFFLLSLIVFGAVAVRFYGLDWALPYHFHSDERILMISAERLRMAHSISTLPIKESQFFIYPPLMMHLLLLVAAPLFHIIPFSPADPAATTLYYVLGRGISATFGVATVILVFILGTKAYSRAAGLLGSAFLAFAVLHVRDSHFFTTDVAMTFFLTLLLILSLRIAAGAGTRIWVLTGIVTGLGLATKQTTLIFSPILLLAHLMATFSSGAVLPVIREKLLARAFWKPLLLFGAVAATTTVIMDPYPLLAPDVFLGNAASLSKYLKGTDQRNWVFQFTGTSPLYWFTNLLWFGMGPLLMVTGFLGVAWALARRKTADLLILAFLALYFGAIGTGFMKFIRYAIPLIPFLALLGARFLAEIHERARGATRWIVRAAGASVLLFSLLLTLAYLNIYRAGDTRVQASRWIRENIPPGTTVVADNSQTTPLLGNLFAQPNFFDNYILCLNRDDCVINDHFTIKVLNMKSYNSHSLKPPERFEAYLRERLAGAEYVIVGDEFYEQYRKRESDYPTVVQFYRDLYAGKRGFREVRAFKSRPSLFGFEWNDDRAELSCRMFDHPHIRIFRRVGPEFST